MKGILVVFLLVASALLLNAQTFQTLCFFNGTNGMSPMAGLTQGKDDSFYGTTISGGNSNRGTIFRVTANGTLTSMVRFDNTNGASPYGGLTMGVDGSFYGMTVSGGITNSYYSAGMGTVFRMTTNGMLTTLVYFAGTNGAQPYGGLTLANDGSFYGMTASGGITNSVFHSGMGTVFRMTTNGTLTTLVYFAGTNGAQPYGSLTMGNDGNYYGTTYEGGITNSVFTAGMGTIFRVTTNGTLNSLVMFANTNGANPHAGLTMCDDGSFYGTTVGGGNTNSVFSSGMGTTFRMTTNGSLTTLVYFAGTNGAQPYADSGLMLAKDGSFYGTTVQGGNNNRGIIFRVTTNGTQTSLVFFATTNGARPFAGLTIGKDGNLYGTTTSGGITNPVFTSGMGTVYRLMFEPNLAIQVLGGFPLLGLNGILSRNFEVQYSTNLTTTNWLYLLTITNLSVNPYQFQDPTGSTKPARFYRAVMQ